MNARSREELENVVDDCEARLRRLNRAYDQASNLDPVDEPAMRDIEHEHEDVSAELRWTRHELQQDP